ncbi:Glucosamine 6-phosphate N-acetyltransferase [Leishmania donovani]|uniref:Acetyltransferase (GNAT) family protein n=1 Tax=Leishmania donovani TaxID=5661 RepID=A0A0R6Y3S5_LEIDO|nr:actyltransferase-like protein [Leishmania donovani]AKK31198.1 actyltransferase-like protein [Leishmania donovani]TPP45148.1 Acetyltransferase (GNAT) family protein [Leishmania donovani]TPP50118.1 Acetyltransferase (GNAT) family protein [Leishmania donovani]CAJ1987152.1 Glucosamine 6-phosphate N-acetyltransferase [Leishmania donovani]CBZ32549.1 actyltransferase-like protein [Leishmania donovani]
MASTANAGVDGLCPATRDAAAEVLWAKLDEVQKLLANKPDAKELFTKYTVFRSVVGEVKPVFTDSVRTRVKVFCEEPAFAVPEECDDFEPVSLHVVAYLNYTLFMEEMRELMVQARLLKSIGMEGSGLRFQRREQNIVAPDNEPRTGSSSKPSGQVSMHKPSYRPATLIPVGTLRMRRVSKASEAGKLAEVVAKIERVCVVKSARCFDAGRALMRAAEKIARDAFHVRWALTYAQLSSKDFYTKAGYTPKDGRACMDLHTPHVVMIKCLVDASM